MSLKAKVTLAAPVLILGLASPLLMNCDVISGALGGCDELESGNFANFQLKGAPAEAQATFKALMEASYNVDKLANEIEVGLIASCKKLGGELGMPEAELAAEPGGGDGAKKVCEAVSCVETGGYGLAPVTREARWRVGPHGIREPVDALRMDPGEVDAVVVPGVAFDAYGRRLGHGGGHYDRLLLDMARSRGRSPFRGGLAFDFQMFDRVPVDEWDVPVDAVVTETKEMRALGSAEGKAVEG